MASPRMTIGHSQAAEHEPVVAREIIVRAPGTEGALDISPTLNLRAKIDCHIHFVNAVGVAELSQIHGNNYLHEPR